MDNNIIADLHLHSKYSRAVSKHMELPTMAQWAVKKGIDLLAIPDWTHPLFLKEVEALIDEAENGIYQLKQSKSPARFVFSTEISSIYSQGGRGRRIHNLVMAPSINTVYKINKELKARGCNLLSDGRPIIGLSSIQLAELVFSIDKDCLIIPAHIWTPWFSMFGSRSGFDSLSECWGEYAKQIFAIETGLSSSPAMNWRVGELDKLAILSNSDAHSPAKIGREAVVLSSKENKPSFTYQDLSNAIKQDKNSSWQISYTIEFYPEEGKYHWTGHRKCGVSLSAKDCKDKGTICSVCGKPLTVGVENRANDLSVREVKVVKKKNKAGLVGYFNQNNPARPPYLMLVPLQEIIAESLGVKNTYSVKVQSMYESLVSQVAPEFDLLIKSNLDTIKKQAGDKIAQAVAKVRNGDIVLEPGYDGQFGVVKIWGNVSSQSGIKNKQIIDKKEQMSLF
jgi:uncharacterized protein (TIGR00375 family)